MRLECLTKDWRDKSCWLQPLNLTQGSTKDEGWCDLRLPDILERHGHSLNLLSKLVIVLDS